MGKIKKRISEERIEPIYLPISLPRYKRNKVLVLKTMISMIECMKRIENIRNLKKEKAKLVEELRRLLNFSKNETNNFNRDLPFVENKIEMRKVRVTQRVSLEKEFSYEEPSFSSSSFLVGSQKTDSLDKELAEIKATLEKLSK